MIGKSIFWFTVIATICDEGFAVKPQEVKDISRVHVQFDLNVNDTKIPYQIDVLVFGYNVNRLTLNINKESRSADINIAGSRLLLIHGDPISANEERVYTPLTFVRDQFLTVNTVGTAELIADGPYIKNCQFTFTESSPARRTEVPAVVKQAVLDNLNDWIGEQLCRSINETN